jgi:DNA-3-methyladenine glycosylase
MFGPPGFAYVYFNYGMYWLLNVTAEPEGQPAAILIRAAQPLSGQELMFARRPKARSEHDLLSGPGKMTLAFGITGQHNGLDLLDPNSELKIERGEVVSHIIERKRVGLSEGKGEHLPWRFIDAEALYWVSRPGLSDVKRARDSMSFSLYP